jgi:hypothetical protein
MTGSSGKSACGGSSLHPSLHPSANPLKYPIAAPPKQPVVSFKMLVAEMGAAVARYMVTMNSGLQEDGVVGNALLATAGISRLRTAIEDHATTVADSLQRLQAEIAVDATPLDWTRKREELRAEHRLATTTHDRETLLAAYKTLMDRVEKHIRPEDLEEFKELRRQDYSLLLFREGMIGNDTDILDTHVMAAITSREVAAGRMSPDNELHKLAVAGSFILD